MAANRPLREAKDTQDIGTLVLSLFDRRPILIALAGPNGAGKTTFCYAYLKQAGLRLVNADIIARELSIDAYAAAAVASSIREELVQHRESFIFESVFSDPVGDKLAFLKRAAASGYTVILCFIGISGADISEERVSMRVTQGGHDVPTAKLNTRYPRVLKNLQTAVLDVPYVMIYDNDDLDHPYRLVAVYERGAAIETHPSIPKWLQPILPAR